MGFDRFLLRRFERRALALLERMTTMTTGNGVDDKSTDFIVHLLKLSATTFFVIAVLFGFYHLFFDFYHFLFGTTIKG